jgi:hypothetical protein
LKKPAEQRHTPDWSIKELESEQDKQGLEVSQVLQPLPHGKQEEMEVNGDIPPNPVGQVQIPFKIIALFATQVSQVFAEEQVIHSVKQAIHK